MHQCNNHQHSHQYSNNHQHSHQYSNNLQRSNLLRLRYKSLSKNLRSLLWSNASHNHHL